MNRKERVAHFLLYAYPAAWRREYGDELAGLLASRPVRLAVIVDVVFNGAVQRWKRDAPWKTGAIACFLWTLICITWNSIKPLSPAAYVYVFWVFNFVTLAVAYRTIVRDPTRFRHAMVASVKSALIGISPDFVAGLLWASHVLHPTVLDMHGSPRIHGAGITILSSRTDAIPSAPEFLTELLLILAAQSLFCGFLGSVLGRFVAAIKAGYQRT